MPAVAEIGAVLERFGQRLQSRDVPREPITPYEHAKRLWEYTTSGRKTDSVETAFFRFQFVDDNGVNTKGREQNVFTNLLKPYRGLFPELDGFNVSLSVGDEIDDISFKLAVFAPEPSPKFNHDKPYPVFVVRELPRLRRSESTTPYNLLILGESELYSGKLDNELVGLNEQAEPVWQRFEEWHEEVRGSVRWRTLFTTEMLKLFTHIVEPSMDYLGKYNQEVLDHYKEREKAVSWWNRTSVHRLHPAAVWPEAMELYYSRVGLIGSSPTRVINYLQQV